ncbi:MAG: hypothetical protein FWG44_02440 [Oscillospiraceae bacterium]|nr:hypothetical protein [Oscillospiraceae bacterium]
MGKTSAASINKYAKKAYDHIHLTVPKGKKALLQEYTKKQGESVNGFINRAIDNQIENDNKTAD